MVIDYNPKNKTNINPQIYKLFNNEICGGRRNKFSITKEIQLINREVMKKIMIGIALNNCFNQARATNKYKN